VTRLRVPFLSAALHEDAAAVRAAIDRVVASGWFILGPEVEAFEREFAAAAGVRYAVGVGTGTDAIALALRALGIGRGDESSRPRCRRPTARARDLSWPAHNPCLPISTRRG
jgi:hypothetical protein